MELYGCGINEAGNMPFQPHCHRFHINGLNPCEHNTHGRLSDDRSYCPLMILKPARILAARSVRLINAFHTSTFLDINGKLLILPLHSNLQNRFPFPAAKHIVQFFKFDAMTELAFNTKNGGLWTLDNLEAGTKEMQRHNPTLGRGILHLCLGGYPNLFCVVTKLTPNIVAEFLSFDDCFSWLVGPREAELQRYITFPTPVEQIVGNLSAFTVRVEGGDVYTWDAKTPYPSMTPESDTAPTPTLGPFNSAATRFKKERFKNDEVPVRTEKRSSTQIKSKDQTKSQIEREEGFQPQIKSEEDVEPQIKREENLRPQIKAAEESNPSIKTEEEEKGPDMSAFDDYSTLSSKPPQSTPKSRVSPPPPLPTINKVPIPPSTYLSTCRFTTGSISRSGLHLWRDPSQDIPRGPRISSVGTLTNPILQDLRNTFGQPVEIIDVSVAPHHIIALAATGEVFSVGRGWYGELGVGVRQFELRAVQGDVHPLDEEGMEFAEHWQRVDLSALGEGMQVCEVGTGYGTTFLIAMRERDARQRLWERAMGLDSRGASG